MTTSIRYQTDDDGSISLDEIVATGRVHLEQMSDSYWCLIIEDAAGQTINISIGAKRAKVRATLCEGRGEFRLDGKVVDREPGR